MSWRDLWAELAGRVCACGAEKGVGKSLCLGCYRSLPTDLQQGLYRRMGEGYEQAYEDASRYLREEAGRLELTGEDE